MFITQLRKAVSDQTFTSQIRPSSQAIGPEDFFKGVDHEEEKDLAEIILEEAGVFQKQEQPSAVIMLAYYLQRPTPRTPKQIACEAIQEEHDPAVTGDANLVVGGSGSSNTLEATGPGAAGKLTGPMVAPRQEQ